jgi:ssDNA-binding Zn-finger/Zn-ribbon topoisomerase 1
MGKKPRFFCDNCGAEVAMSAKICPQCGRFFASVRCPKCGFTGKDEDFVRGCPVCGYSSVPGLSPAKPSGGHSGKRTPVERKRSGEAEGTLPFWFYLFAALALICVLALLYNSLR